MYTTLTLLLSPSIASKQYISASFHDLPKAGKWLCLCILYLHLHCMPASEFLLPAFCFPKPFLAADFSVFRRCSDGVRRCLSVPYVIVPAVAVHSICHRCFCFMSHDASGHGSNTLFQTLRRSWIFIRQTS